MDFTNYLSVSSDTKEYMVSCIKPKSKELFILLNMIHFIERIIRLTSCSVDTKENSILGIYYSHYKLFILDYSKWGVLNFTSFILDSCLIKILCHIIKISQDACKGLRVFNISKELFQLIHGVNDICCVLITHDGCYSLCKKSYL